MQVTSLHAPSGVSIQNTAIYKQHHHKQHMNPAISHPACTLNVDLDHLVQNWRRIRQVYNLFADKVLKRDLHYLSSTTIFQVKYKTYKEVQTRWARLNYCMCEGFSQEHQWALDGQESFQTLYFKVSISLELRQRQDLWEANVNTGTTPRHQMPFYFPHIYRVTPPHASRIEWAVVAWEEAKRVYHKQD